MEETQFLALIDQHQGIIHKVCRIYRDSKEDREDLFQEIVFQLWKSVPDFEYRARFSTWMYRIALSTAIAGFRKKKPDITYTSSLPDISDAQQEPGGRSEQLFDAVGRLNDADKAIMLLYLENLSYQEIAHITGITENNVGVRLNRIKSKIQQLLNIK
ncbi:RNA polymerase sigma factor [Gynurincola endophyticus]|uniref:RNA polymerase sigma factor n=1 Tax=Gynurincola endophyticus TaxID=2479004 RepID=UPI000F8D6B3F|nr:sigma-70 family RNA polymerase sigma factor [Gynurincola endophyticus]